MPSDRYSDTGIKLPIRPKAIAFDLDGTLLDYEGNLTPGVEKAVKLMSASGLKVFLITGRLQPSATKYWRIFGLDTPMATCNGAQVGYPDSPLLFNSNLSLSARNKIMEVEVAHKLYVNYYINNLVYSVTDGPVREYYSQNYSPVVLADSLEAIRAMDLPTKCLCIVDEIDNPAVTSIFSKALGDEINLTESNKRFIELLPPGADKAEGLRQLVKWANISTDECVAVGDGLNDLPMLQAAGFSITFSSGDQRLREHVDMVLPPLWQDGMDTLASVVLGMTDSGRFLTSRSQRFLRK